ncbi:DUF4085 family protein [Bacillus sp. FDAARGOS_1420]|uniref:DUF4085 family protein n=1 Tax=unclassified Bacillus (in: firmicutes) TaxID=185979 RepID=UPI001C5ACF1A|nr:DUF4085 family protein [Bacillus sp. FDAARGOS_1420]MBW3494264.1 DUF4085 domain-containing protein [Bacillus sp. FDAARGOS_1420]
MKYYNKNWYKEMQMIEFVSFIESIEEWTEMDIQSLLDEIAERKLDLLKFLPASIYSLFHTSIINSKYPSDELKKLLKEWIENCEKRRSHLDRFYLEHFHSIKKTLPLNAIQLHEYSLHDSVVKSVERRSKDTLIITLDCSGTFSEFDKLEVTFTGVTKCSIPENFEGAWWLYHEIDLTNEGFELGVLFDCPFEEVTICAKDVLLEMGN